MANPQGLAILPFWAALVSGKTARNGGGMKKHAMLNKLLLRCAQLDLAAQKSGGLTKDTAVIRTLLVPKLAGK